MSHRYLHLAVFVSGMSVMAVEMSASRLLAPYFGTALTVWTALIGIIMVALTFGYWAGGRLADRKPEAGGFYRVLLVGGLLVVAIPAVSDLILGGAAGASQLGAILGSFVGVAVLFAIPVGILGMVSPYAIRLVSEGESTAGASAGKVYAVSTAGSILGTFLPGFVLIPLVGTKATILGCGVLLSLVAAGGLGSRAAFGSVVGAGAVVAALVGPMKQIKDLVHAQESAYNYIQVVQRTVERKDHTRKRNLLVLNEGRAVHSVHDPDSPSAPLVGAVWDFMNVPVALAYDGKPMHAALVGLAAGTVPHQWIEFFGEAWDLKVSGAEIDPAILEVGRKYFSIADDEETGRLDAQAVDGRVYLARQEPGSLDVVLTDAYKQPYIPFHLATREYFELVHDRLKQGGIMAMNVGAISTDAEIFRRLLSSAASVFGEVKFVLVKNYGVPFNNHVVLAGKGPIDWTRMNPRQHPALQQVIEDGNQGLGTIFRLALRNLHDFEPDPERVFTDDKAPVEFYTEKMIFDYLAEGGGIPSA